MAIELELVYLLAMQRGPIRFAVPACDGENKLGKEREIDGWTAFAMVNYWPEHSVRCEANVAKGWQPSDEKWFVHVARLDSTLARNPIFGFYTSISWEQATREVAKLGAHFSKRMTAETLKSLDLFERMEAVIQDRAGYLEQIESEARGREAAETRKKEREARAAVRNDPSSNFNRAERSIRAGTDFTLIRFADFSDKNITFDSSLKKALAVLANPDTVLHQFVEDEGEQDGLVSAWFEYSDRTKHPDNPSHRIEFRAPRLAELDRRTGVATSSEAGRARG